MVILDLFRSSSDFGMRWRFHEQLVSAGAAYKFLCAPVLAPLCMLVVAAGCLLLLAHLPIQFLML